MKKQILILAFAIFSLSTLCKAQIKIFNGGWVSIGTTAAPLYSFHQIMGGIAFPKTTSSITSAAYIRGNNSYSFASSPDYTWAGNDQCGMFHPASNTIGFCTSNSRKVTIDSYGNFGIGDSTPASILTVGNGDLFQVTSSGYVRSVNGSATNPTYSFTATGSTNTGMYSSGTGILNFSTNGTQRMVIDASGNFGIGISQPLYKVHIEYSDDFPGIYINKSSTTSNALNIVSKVNATLTKSFLSINNTTSNFCVWGDGQVNVGGVYHDATYKLTVYGSAYATGTFYSGSDINFKQNLAPITTSIDKLNQLNGYRYSYNTNAFPNKNFPTGYTYGVIAQEVQTVLPELVMADSAGYLAVNYDGLIPVLIEAIKEQQITIKEQGDRINILETDLAKCCTAATPANKSLQLPNNSGNNENSNSGSPALYQNIPNPFNSKTDIGYYLPNETTNASLLVFDMQGKLIKTYKIDTFGKGNVEINAGELQPGMYMYSLISNGKEIDTKKMILTD